MLPAPRSLGRRDDRGVAIVALLAWARNDPGVDDREPDPESTSSKRSWTRGAHDGRPRPADDVSVDDPCGRHRETARRATTVVPRRAIPVVVLIVLLTLTIVLFGIDAANGPLQVALLTSAMVAGLVAFKNGYTAGALRDAAIGGVTSAMGAIFILLAVGALIGTWNMAGTIPTVVSYGIALLRPAIFYAAVALICAVVGAVTGSSWTTAGTLGVAFLGMAPILGMSTTIAAGAVISGAYMGDKMSPLSETTVLVPSLVGGVTVNQHIRGMLWTVGPSFVMAFLVYLVIGIVDDPASSAIGVDQARDTLADGVQHLPAQPPAPGVADRGHAAQGPAVPRHLRRRRLLRHPGLLHPAGRRRGVRRRTRPGRRPRQHRGRLPGAANGFESASGNATIDDLFSSGGMSSMLTTVWLILGCAELRGHHGGGRLPQPSHRPDHRPRPHRRRRDHLGRRTSAGLNVVAGDQYVAVVLPSRVFRDEFARRRLAPRMLSRTVEDTGTVTSPLVPWNSCGAYMTGVLGVPTASTSPSPSSTCSTRSSPSPTPSPASASNTSPMCRRPSTETGAAAERNPPAHHGRRWSCRVTSRRRTAARVGDPG